MARLRPKSYPYPNDVRVNATSRDILALQVAVPELSQRYTLAGRLVQIRLMGKASFVHILDGVGKLQIYLKADVIGEAAYEELRDLDLGDIIEVRGYAFVTKTGEHTLFAESFRLLTKCLIPLPEKWHGLADVEARYRQRYLDLIANPEVRDTFRARARIIRELRTFLDNRDFLEVETPVLHYVAGGAEAKPFKTHHNALGCDMHLRIALELPLKKLIVGGFDRVYEIGRVFRNEGLSRKHNPEFTMLELYQAYANFEDFMQLTEELICHVAMKLHSQLKIKCGERELDLTPPWPRISMLESIHTIGGVDRKYDLNTNSALLEVAKIHRIEIAEKDDWGRLLEGLWGELVEPKIFNPVFITQHPFSISPLARRNLNDPKVTDRFELIIAGMEIVNVFSELNDPQDQRERFLTQASRREKGDQEAPEPDEEFLKALEYGLPPTAGFGMGIDRFTMLLTNSSAIRDVVLFPQLKPESLKCSAEELSKEQLAARK